jgi:hypothetical protein
MLRGVPEESLLILADRNMLSFSMNERTDTDDQGRDVYTLHNVRYYYDKDLYDWNPDCYDFDEIAPHWGYSAQVQENDEA